MSSELPFGTHLRRLRQGRGLTQEALAEAAACAVDTLRAIESGRRRPSRSLAAILAERLDVPPAERQAFLDLARGLAPAQPAAPPRPAAPAAPPRPSLALQPEAVSVIGRGVELGELAGRLADPACRLLTIVGPGGIGKTSLASQLAVGLAERFADGAITVALAGENEAAGALGMIAHAVGAALGGEDSIAQIVTALRPRTLLLILDNLEQLLGGPELHQLIAAIIAGAPGVKLLLTSREHLNLAGEWVYELKGLRLPENEDDAAIAASEAVLLFVARARRLRHTFALTPENRAAVARICRLLEGVPLAIELAATWIIVLAPAEIADELSRGLGLLDHEQRDRPERHRSMRVVFDGSWRLLTPGEQSAMVRLSLFRGGFTREAADYVGLAPLPVLAALIGKSLLRREGERYSLHELIRQYSAQQLEGHPEQAAIEARFVRYLLASAAHAAATAPDEAALIRRLRGELENFRAVVQFGQTRPALTALAAQLYIVIDRYWQLLGSFREPAAWAEGLLAAGPLPLVLRTTLQLVVAHNLVERGNPVHALAAARSGLELARQTGDEALVRRALHTLGTGEGLYGDYERGEALLREAQLISRRQGNGFAESSNLNNLAHVHWHRGRLAEAAAVFAEAVVVARQSGQEALLGGTLAAQASVEAALGWPVGAAHAGEALALSMAYEDVSTALEALEVVAAYIGRGGDQRRAATLFGAAAAERERQGLTVEPWRRSTLDAFIAEARDGLSAWDWADAWAAGRRLSLSEAAALA